MQSPSSSDTWKKVSVQETYCKFPNTMEKYITSSEWQRLYASLSCTRLSWQILHEFRANSAITTFSYSFSGGGKGSKREYSKVCNCKLWETRKQRTVLARSSVPKSRWAVESGKGATDPGERRSVLRKITAKSSPNSLIESRRRCSGSPACLINLTCREQRPWRVVIPSIVITSITVLHLTAGCGVTVGHVLGLPHEQPLHGRVESGTENETRASSWNKKKKGQKKKKVRDLHWQGGGGWECEQPDQRRAGLETVALISWKNHICVECVYSWGGLLFFGDKQQQALTTGGEMWKNIWNMLLRLKKMKRKKKCSRFQSAGFQPHRAEKRDLLSAITWEWMRNVEHAAPADETAFEFLSDIRPESLFQW